jgi:sterol desaturase/sphingolipid hydroxylase (fatty acid hydroxylase superfamily)
MIDLPFFLRDVLERMGLATAFFAFLASNVVLFGSSLALGHAVARVWQSRRVTPMAPRVEMREWALAATCVVLNAAITTVGLALYRAGIIRLRPATFLEVPLDAALLTALMDVAMYASHRLAHQRWIYEHVHGVHHRYDHPRPLSLFVLHPLEVLGFGGMWLGLISVVTVSLPAMILFLTLNLLFGTLGHVGVEPLPRAWVTWRLARSVGTSTFHARHHETPCGNYGFYTTVWDRMFGTLDGTYVTDFGATRSTAALANASRAPLTES